ncbi:MAG: 2-(3-amino-3-carboxypropyl)histidine synthase subunit 1/2 [Candidatus Woesearchaeota archaeon]
MKTLFIEAKANISLKPNRDVLKKIKELPKRIGIITTVQHVHKIKEFKQELKKIGKEVYSAKGNLTKYESQILGCDINSALKIKDKVDFYIYIGTGRFHPIEVLMKTQKPVFVYNPYSQSIKEISQSEIEEEYKKIRLATLKFLSSKKIGILVSTKIGQKRLDFAFELKRKIEEKGKKAFVLLFETLDFSQLENFNFVDCFINTACPRLIDDYERFPKPVVNAEEILNYLK